MVLIELKALISCILSPLSPHFMCFHALPNLQPPTNCLHATNLQQQTHFDRDVMLPQLRFSQDHLHRTMLIPSKSAKCSQQFILEVFLQYPTKSCLCFVVSDNTAVQELPVAKR